MGEYISTLSNSAVFTTSGIFTVPKGVKSIDVFCVGGGGGSIKNETASGYYDSVAYNSAKCSGGGGGGYTKTSFNLNLSENEELAITIGAGCQGMYLYSFSYSCAGSTAVSYANDTLISAIGGYGSRGMEGGNGGSGGGEGSSFTNYYYMTTGTGGFTLKQSNIYSYPNIGGTDGGDGGNPVYNDFVFNRCKGQGTTTRYFGESDGTLYSTGGCGYYANNGWYNIPTANTGDGSSGCNNIIEGASGIAIIRWSDQK
jgi:hypothetical protein